MGSTKVKSDSHGLYVRGGGYVWRPEFPASYPTEGLIPEQGHSNHREGDRVTVSHKGGTMLASVVEHGPASRARYTERWYCHGQYISTAGPISSELMYFDA
jgi:hypothetical protein